MLFFKSKARKEAERNKTRKIAAISKISQLCDEAYEKRVISVKVELDLLKTKMDNPDLTLSSEQLDCVEECLSKIQSHMDKQYAEYIKEKCQKIGEALKGKPAPSTEEEKAKEANCDEIAELMAGVENQYAVINQKIDEVTALNAKIEQIKKEQSDCLENKAQWKKLFYDLKKEMPKLQMANSELQALERNIQIQQQNLNMFIKQNQNIATAELIKQASAFASKIETQKNLVDIDVANEYAKHFKEQNNEVQSTGNELDNIVNANFNGASDGLGDDDAEIAYQRACEAKAIQKLDETNCPLDSSSEKEK